MGNSVQKFKSDGFIFFVFFFFFWGGGGAFNTPFLNRFYKK